MKERHLILSSPHPVSDEQARQFHQAYLDWIKNFAPPGTWLAVMKRDDAGRFHLHITVQEKP
jgi:hypothetical protein